MRKNDKSVNFITSKAYFQIIKCFMDNLAYFVDHLINLLPKKPHRTQKVLNLPYLRNKAQFYDRILHPVYICRQLHDYIIPIITRIAVIRSIDMFM